MKDFLVYFFGSVHFSNCGMRAQQVILERCAVYELDGYLFWFQ